MVPISRRGIWRVCQAAWPALKPVGALLLGIPARNLSRQPNSHNSGDFSPWHSRTVINQGICPGLPVVQHKGQPFTSYTSLQEH